MPATYALNMFGLSFATIPALLVWIFLEKRKEMSNAFRGILNIKSHLHLRRGTADSVPSWWYMASG